MKKRRLNYRFHNPNPEADTAEFLAKLLTEVNQAKVAEAIRIAGEAAEEKPAQLVQRM